MSDTVYLHKPGMVCALGDTTDAIAAQLFASQPRPLTPTDAFTPGLTLPLGQVTTPIYAGPLAATDESRNNRLLLTAMAQLASQLEALRQRYPAHRIGVVLGTSTSGIGEAEQAFRQRDETGRLPVAYHYSQQEIGAPAQFLARHLQLAGPAITVSTACSSGAKALASARRLLRQGICDAVLCGGVDSLCRLTVNGFHALESVSQKTCRPSGSQRDGINIGEGACVFVMTRDSGPVELSGVGETSDAHHISAPHPEGRGASAAISAALADAGVDATAIGYVNLHGTATPQNDRMEHLAVNRQLGDQVPCSSTKPLIGHTLGAAGALEAAFCWLTLTGDGQLPPHWLQGEVDAELAPLTLAAADERLGAAPRHALSNSFAFGGNNIALLLSRAGQD